jgi:hypothetical protein
VIADAASQDSSGSYGINAWLPALQKGFTAAGDSTWVLRCSGPDELGWQLGCRGPIGGSPSTNDGHVTLL